MRPHSDRLERLARATSHSGWRSRESRRPQRVTVAARAILCDSSRVVEMVCGHIQASRGKGSWSTCHSPSCLPRSCPQFDGTFIKGTFIMLHTWANAVMALTYHPELTSSHSGVETPLTQNIDRSIRLSLSCSRAVSECMIYADLFQTTSYVRCSPCSRVYLTALIDVACDS